ncbi:cold-regulated protein 27 [Castanea sativa]|uniref:cold-regulated protein 27 n=1 Tax=Castanea sativa TaxID=21020 RepID=UPI003F6514F4
MKDFKARVSGSSPPPSSALTAEASSSLGNLLTDRSSDWTDEKHSLYLKSMEASFVNELYDNRQKHLNTRNPSGQFKVLRGGCWQKVNFNRADLQLKKAAGGSRSLLANPWIQHFRSSCTTQVVASADVQKNGASKSQALGLAGTNSNSSCGRATCNSNQIDACQFHSCHQDLIDDNTEVSDQNFVDEVVEGEKESSKHNAKRIKSSTASTSSHDQVVPRNKSPAAEDVAENCISGAR